MSLRMGVNECVLVYYSVVKTSICPHEVNFCIKRTRVSLLFYIVGLEEMVHTDPLCSQVMTDFFFGILS